ncbi:universal stress protein [Mesorhizobium australicum]
MYKHLLIATDGSDLADKGVAQGLTLAKGIGAAVTFIIVSEQFPIFAWGDAMAGYATGDELVIYQEEEAPLWQGSARQMQGIRRRRRRVRHAGPCRGQKGRPKRSWNCRGRKAAT